MLEKQRLQSPEVAGSIALGTQEFGGKSALAV